MKMTFHKDAQARWAVWGFASLVLVVSAPSYLGAYLPSLPLTSVGLDQVAAMLAGALLLNLAIGVALLLAVAGSRLAHALTDVWGHLPFVHRGPTEHPRAHRPGGYLN